MEQRTDIPKQFLGLMNQVFDIERKAAKLTERHTMGRNIDRMKNTFSEMGLEMFNPMGEAYDETRTDCEASIAGNGADNLVITDVIKPLIRMRHGGASVIVQKAVVIVESKR